MEQIPCFYCGGFFDPSPRHKNQTACKKVKCQRAKKAAWQRHRIKTDPIYAANQESSQQQWINSNPGYWKKYRKKNPEKAERNRILQTIRNRKARDANSLAKMDACRVQLTVLSGFSEQSPILQRDDSMGMAPDS